MNSLHVEMYYEPQVSVNACYGTNRKTGVKYMKKKAKLWRNELILLVRAGLNRADWHPPEGAKLEVAINCRFPLRKGQKPDSNNFLKVTVDAVAEALGWKSDHTIDARSVGSHSKLNGNGSIFVSVFIPDEVDGYL